MDVLRPPLFPVTLVCVEWAMVLNSIGFPDKQKPQCSTQYNLIQAGVVPKMGIFVFPPPRAPVPPPPPRDRPRARQ